VTVVEILLIACGLSMDTFAVAICKGLSLPQAGPRQAAVVGAWFGAFQGGMPLLGYLVGSQFASYIAAYDHWVAFVLLAVIGIRMVLESRTPAEETVVEENPLAAGKMLPMAVATSIDALAVGVTMAFLGVNILMAGLLIGVTTCLFSMAGVHLGGIFGLRYKSRAELAGGVILILIGCRMLYENLGM